MVSGAEAYKSYKISLVSTRASLLIKANIQHKCDDFVPSEIPGDIFDDTIGALF